MENNFQSNLFVSREYLEYTFSYKGLTETIKHCNSATTDFDLTGQIVWPASEALAMYIMDHAEQFAEKTVLELGAGAGLSGIVCSHYSKNVIVTDGNDVVVELLSLNALAVKPPRDQRVKAAKFDWKDYRQFYSQYCAELDIIIGADIMFWPSSMRPLCECIRYMANELWREHHKKLRIVVALQCRSLTTEAEFDEILKENGLRRVLLQKVLKVPVWEIEVL